MQRYFISSKVPEEFSIQIINRIIKMKIDYYYTEHDKINRFYDIRVCVPDSVERANLLTLLDSHNLRAWCKPE